ncbi:MAG: IS1595 family transposase [Alphaproteobacteria bacterium]|nr:IS1595 family transposase [Alphaproteobacteria bacterium]
MSQHFLLSKAARSLSLSAVARMSEGEAREAFTAIRWAETAGKPFCPRCGCASVYAYASRRIYKCQGCKHQFTITSGTIFASRKLPVRDILLAIAIFVNGAKGHSALQLSRDLNVQYKTAFVLAHKIREAIASEGVSKVGGNGKPVEIDGAYFGGYIKPANWREHRRDRRLARNQNGKRRCVVVMRERRGKTLPFICRTEDQAVPEIKDRVAAGSVVYADEAGGWEPLHARYLTKRINHKEAYSDGEACTNQAESFFSRIRRAEIGTHHHIAGPYLAAYADEMSWREDNRRTSNGELYLMAANAAVKHPTSKQWKGYWQRRVIREAAE